MLTPAEEGDLKWYFAGADGSLGLRSSWESLCYRAQVGPVPLGGRDALADDQVMESIARVRGIERVLARMPRESVRVLRRWVEGSAPVALVETLGREARVLSSVQQLSALAALEQGNRSMQIVWRERAAAALLRAVRELREAKTRRNRRAA